MRWSKGYLNITKASKTYCIVATLSPEKHVFGEPVSHSGKTTKYKGNSETWSKFHVCSSLESGPDLG